MHVDAFVQWTLMPIIVTWQNFRHFYVRNVCLNLKKPGGFFLNKLTENFSENDFSRLVDLFFISYYYSLIICSYNSKPDAFKWTFPLTCQLIAAVVCGFVWGAGPMASVNFLLWICLIQNRCWYRLAADRCVWKESCSILAKGVLTYLQKVHYHPHSPITSSRW